MLPLRFCLVGVGLIVLAFGTLWLTGVSRVTDPLLLLGDFMPALFGQFLILTVAGTGILFICRGIWQLLRRTTPVRQLLRIFPELPLRHVTRWNKRSVGPSLIPSMLNAFSVSWICVLMNLLIVFQVLRPRPPFGISVDWKRRSHIAAMESPWAETMSVYVGPRCEFYVNGKEIGGKRLDVVLKNELGRRTEWTVYVEADQNSMFMCTASAIDTIQGVGGKVVWITPGMRAEWNTQNHAPEGAR